MSRLAWMSGGTSAPRVPWIGAIDAGTASARFFVFDESGKVLARARQSLSLQSPHSGYSVYVLLASARAYICLRWVEQDAMEMALGVEACIKSACDDLRGQGYDPEGQIKAIGITNQRETTIAWDAHTGRPLAEALVWMDTRNAADIAALRTEGPTIGVSCSAHTSVWPNAL